MQSKIDRSIVYPVSLDIVEHDVNIVSDLWTVEGREVFRGGRDPNYTHANVYWLYDQDELDRVGVAEHNKETPADVNVLWHRDTPFGTLLQEDGWEERDSLWYRLPEHVYDQFLSEEWSKPADFLERCLRGTTRILTPDMLVKMPVVWSCVNCGQSLKKTACATEGALDFPEKEKVFFIDERMIMYTPPKGSMVWSRLGFTTPPEPSEPSSEQPVSASEVETMAESQPAA